MSTQGQDLNPGTSDSKSALLTSWMEGHQPVFRPPSLALPAILTLVVVSLHAS